MLKWVHQIRERSLKLTILGLLNVSPHYPIYQVVKTLFHCSSQRLNVCFYSFECIIFQGMFSIYECLVKLNLFLTTLLTILWLAWIKQIHFSYKLRLVSRMSHLTNKSCFLKEEVNTYSSELSQCSLWLKITVLDGLVIHLLTMQFMLSARAVLHLKAAGKFDAILK